MNIKTKKVYYCSFCKKHGLSSYHIQQHEKHCTLNPNRVCGVCERKEKVNKQDITFIKKSYNILMSKKDKDGILGIYCAEFKEKIKYLADKLECPACMLSVLRQSKIGWSYVDYNYEEEMKKYWEKEREEEHREEINSLLY